MDNKILILTSASFVDEHGNFVFARAQVYVSVEFFNEQNAILQSFGLTPHEALNVHKVPIEEED